LIISKSILCIYVTLPADDLRNLKLKIVNSIVKINQQHLSIDLNILKVKFNELDQEQLNEDFLITNVPMNDEINADSVVMNIFNLLRCDGRDITKKYKFFNNKLEQQGSITISVSHLKMRLLKKSFFVINVRKLGPIFWEQILPLTKEQNKKFT
jgi:hypothetical protein